MEFDYGALMGSMNQGNMAMDFGINAEDLNIGAVDDMLGGGVDLTGATDLYGSGLTGGSVGDFMSNAKNTSPAMSQVAGIPGVDGGDLFSGLDDGGRMAELNGMNSMLTNRPGMDPSLSAMGGQGSDMYGMLSKGTQGLGGIMGLYNSWQMMNIMNKNEARNQKGFDLANERYDTNHANVKNAFAV